MKIDFHYSTIYDAMLSEMSNKEQDIFQVREVQKFMKYFETSWKKIEKKVKIPSLKMLGFITSL